MKKFFKSIYGKIAGACAFAFASLSATAQEVGTTDVTQITSNVQEVGQSIQDGLEAAVTAALPFITACLIATIGIYVIPLVWRWIKSIFGKR